jgi:protein-S-isoprenylcysteine O-methyltransferase Ste14
VVIQLLLLILLVSVGLSDHGDWPAPIAVVAWIVGLVLMGAGVVLVVRGSRDLGRNLTPTPRPRDGSVLVQHGAYGLVRHPLYGGQIIMAVGWGLVAASLTTLLLAGLLGVFFDLKSRREEAWLSARYPAYPAYAARTRKLIPWVY